MKIQCKVCEAAEAAVLCCADEAALCLSCDEKVHAANKLAGKHQRVPLTISSLPNCDICQEASGFFFCIEDRAILCRKCDVAIHTVNHHVSSHQRFLLTGIRVGLESTDSIIPLKNQSPSIDDTTIETKPSDPKTIHHHDHDHQVLTKLPFSSSGSANGSIPQWQMDEIFGLTDFDQCYDFMENNN